jgi:hypothetical protein
MRIPPRSIVIARTRILFFVVMLLALASPAWAQVQFQTAVYSTPGPGTGCAVQIPIAANQNRALIVGVHTGSASVSGVSGAGAAWAGSAAVTRTSANNHVEIWVGANPSPGTQTVTVTLATSDANMICGVASFFGVNQTAPTAHPTGSTGTGGTAQVTVTSAANNMTFALASNNGFFENPSGCPTTAPDWSTNPNTQTGQGTHCAGAATTTVSWSMSSTWSVAGLDIQSAGGGGGGGGGTGIWSILGPSRAIDWSQTNPGVEGGIPNRTTTCTTLGPGVSADTIRTALQGCTSNGVVMLSAGTYDLSAGIDFSGINNVTLRGAGPTQTILRFAGGTSCGNLWGDICVKDTNGFGTGGWIPPDNTADWTAGYAPGTTQITLSRTTGLSVGSIIVLDQDNDQTDTGNVFVCDVLTCSEEGGFATRNPHGVNRHQMQFVRVTAINGNVVTITPGIYMPNWRAERFPGAWWPGTVAEGIGIENMTLDHTASCSNNPCVGIFFYNAHNSWVRNVKSLNPNRNHVWLYQSSHIQVQDSYFYGTKNAASQSYGVESFMGGDNLVVNNIFQHVTSPLMTGPASGSVFAYNFMIDMAYNQPAWMQASINGGHDAGNAMNLFEGNQGTQFAQDNYHGTNNFATVFRNQLTGAEPGKTDNTEVINLFGLSRYANVVGNVLGTAGYHTIYEDDVSAPTGPPDRAIYLLGFSGSRDTSGILNDPSVRTTMLRWGNYDTKTAATRWDPTEVPSGLSLYANPVPGNQILPKSLFLSAPPAWWTLSIPWPAIGPDVSGGSDPTGHAYAIPARACFDMLKDPNTGTIVNYDIAPCYPAH